jgi:hypothetical protein
MSFDRIECCSFFFRQMEFSFLMSKPFMGIYGSKGMCLDDVHDRVEIIKQLALCCCLLS